MKREIEVKAKIEDIDVLVAKLEGLGCTISEPVVQEDVIFVNFKGDFTEFQPGEIFLRIRKANGKILFTLKQPQKNELDCIEKEVEISDANQLKDALELMGYHEAVRVYKSRRKTNYNGCEICLDEVEDLGSFIEVEKMSDEEDGEKVQSELFDFLETLDVKKEDRVMKGYDTLVWLKNHTGKK